jgi:cytochrome c oxidase cbb3-type subunit III
VLEGRGAMPKFQLTPDQVGDVAAFLHSFSVGSRSIPTEVNILVGDPKKGEAYVTAKCRSCHTVDALRSFALKLDDPKWLQQMWLMPGSGAGRGGGTVPLPAPPVRATVTLPSGEKVEGTVQRIDDFVVSLALDDGTRRTFRTWGTNIRVDLHDPLKPHKALLPVYSDADIHNVTAYLSSLRQP